MCRFILIHDYYLFSFHATLDFFTYFMLIALVDSLGFNLHFYIFLLISCVAGGLDCN